ncbi:MAG: tetratricopeptide repeat protein [Verrucomicrobiaceae bacterium]|nr:MAG: tetratricopeptide repeat protein [Verrucomicrobiaceae bacterium]
MKSSESSRKAESHQLADRIRKLREGKRLAEAEEAGTAALLQHPDDARLVAEHAETAVRSKNWGAAIKRFKLLGKLEKRTPGHDAAVLKLVAVYVALGQPGEAETLLGKALAGHGPSLLLRKAEAELAQQHAGRGFDAARWRTLAESPELPAAGDPVRIPVLSACVAGLRLAGHREEARDLLERHYHKDNPSWKELLKDGYARLVVFDNGHTRAEYLSKLFDPPTGDTVRSGRLAITFDVMEQTWNKEFFAYRPLSPGPTDFLAVRKRSKEDFHQDMRRADFLSFALPVAAGYQDVVALGQSLGAYSALYYASWVPGCRVLATAPRNPLHPRYAGRRYASYQLFTHEYEMPVNPGASPVIVYDPRNPEDGRYVEQSLAVAFPGALLLRYPHCGHSITRYLRDVGVLKTATLAFCDGGGFPAFDRSKRGTSPEFLRNLGKLCLRAGRLDRARALVLRALELGADPERSRELLVKIDTASAGIPST